MKSGTSKMDQIRALRVARAQSSRGGVEAGSRKAAPNAKVLREKWPDTPRSPSTAAAVPHGKGTQAGNVANPETGSTAHRVSRQPSRETKSKRGRPKVQLKPVKGDHAEPWLFAGVSRRTWYRRQAEKSK